MKKFNTKINGGGGAGGGSNVLETQKDQMF